MKKNTTKPTVSPAPATKSVAAKPAAKKKSASAAPRKKDASSPPAAARPAPAPAVAPAPRPVAVKPAPALVPAPAAPAPKPVPAPASVRPVARQPVVTTISARIDIGFGNTLYIRGEGPGLSWDAGVPMECAGDDLWRITLGESAHGLVFKVLVNDLTWNVGPDYLAANGATVTITPEF